MTSAANFETLLGIVPPQMPGEMVFDVAEDPLPHWKHLATLQGGAGCTDINVRPLRLWQSHLLSIEGADRTSLRQFLSKLNEKAEAAPTLAKPRVSHYSWGSRSDQS